MAFLEKKAELEKLNEVLITDQQALADLKVNIEINKEAVNHLEENAEMPNQWLNFGPFFMKLKTDKAIKMLNQEIKSKQKFHDKIESSKEETLSKMKKLSGQSRGQFR